MEIAIFCVFMTLQFSAKYLPALCEKAAQFAAVQRLAQHHWVVWLGHPVIWHGVHDYAVHLAIYSGYFLPTH